MTPLVLLGVLDTFRYQRLKTFACLSIVIVVAKCGFRKDVLQEKVRSFGERNASHLSVSLSTYGMSGQR